MTDLFLLHQPAIKLVGATSYGILMIENLVVEIQNIEAKADSIIADAQKKARQLDVDAENEIKQLTINFEKEFQQKVGELKLRIESSKKKEAAHLKSEFEKTKTKLGHIDQSVSDRVVELIVKEIYEN
ncbi:MAG: hypothetical protein ACUZ77_02470 [Candidatus Brocadiales bacterium]